MMNVEPNPQQLLLREELFSDEIKILAAVNGLHTFKVTVLDA